MYLPRPHDLLWRPYVTEHHARIPGSRPVRNCSSGACRHCPDRADGCPSASPLVLDHTGADIYRSAFTGGECDSSKYQSFSIDKTTGKLNYLGSSASQFLFNTPLTFSASNLYAYGSQCINFQVGYLDTFEALKRESNGFLADTSLGANTPATPSSNQFYCRSITAVDPANHVAMGLQLIDNGTSSPIGNPQIASYTIGSNGGLTTSNTSSNMPNTTVGFIFDLAMSPRAGCWPWPG